MWSSVITFKGGLADLRHYVVGTEKQGALLGLPAAFVNATAGFSLLSEAQEHFRLKNNRARFEYNTIIVSLYGYLERYVEDIIIEYLNYLNGVVPDFAGLPDRVKAVHFELTIDLLKHIDYTKYSSRLRREDVVANLNSCLAAQSNYKLNVDAFAQHGANMRHPTVVECFSRLGVDNLSARIKTAELFTKFIELSDPDQDIDALPYKDDGSLFVILEDLALRRNEVAHGTPTNLISLDILRSYIDFVEVYGETLGGIMEEMTLPYEVKYNTISLGKAVKIFNNEIVCIQLPDVTINVGDVIIAETNDSYISHKSGDILSIQVNKQDHLSITGSRNLLVCLKVSFKAKENQIFYLVKDSLQSEGTEPDDNGPAIRRQEVEKLAYKLYEEAGRPPYQADEHWIRAENILNRIASI